MEHKVLIADDSLTIQKVIKITLANEPFELSDCADPDALANVVRETAPEIVLLDFNLSENKTGYDLCREIKQINPQIGVLMLFGTFDTIDEELLLECGCNYHIVKPFDGNKFINLCRALAQDFQSGEVNEEPAIENTVEEASQEEIPSEIENDFGEDDWVMNQPKIQEPEDEVESMPSFEQNDLAKEVEEWGMEVPSIIGAQDDSSPEVPEVIGESQEEVVDESGPSFDSLQELNIDEEPQEFEVPEDQGIELTQEEPEEAPEEINESEGPTGTETEEDLQRLQSQIEDEPEEEELWAADVVEEPKAPVSEPSVEEISSNEFSAMDADSFDHIDDDSDYVARPAEEIKAQDVPDDFPEAIEPSSLPEKESIVSSAIASTEEISEKIQEELEAQLGSKLSPLVEKYVKDYCREQIERVAWEVIPDLAENIIKKEIQKISNSIMDQ